MRNDAIIIKRVKKVTAHAHHGGAWKVAYADFVTAMMAFFLLLWLLNVTTDEQKNGIAEYFAPATVSRSTSGAGGILGGRTLVIEGSRISQDGVPAVIDDIAPPDPRRVPDANAQQEVARDPTDEEFAAKQAEREQAAFEQAEAALRQAIKDNPQLAELSRHLIVDNTPEGLRIQLVDQEQQSMFPTGSAVMNDRARQLTQAVAQAVLKLPNKLSISGHTDAQPYRTENGYGNWELSTDRANASRRALIEAGVPANRFRQVTGNADQDPLIASEPLNPSNRRISIVLLREAPVVKKAEQQP